MDSLLLVRSQEQGQRDIWGFRIFGIALGSAMLWPWLLWNRIASQHLGACTELRPVTVLVDMTTLSYKMFIKVFGVRTWHLNPNRLIAFLNLSLQPV